jgi:predicted metal-binding membrane protein
VLEAVLRRDRVIVSTALAAIAALAWAYLLWLAASMGMGGEPAPPGMSMPGMLAAEFRPWSAAGFAFAFGMWAVMMVGMMTPSAAPMILIFARVGRQASAQGKPFAATSWFLAGYFLVWLAFALAATAVQSALTQAALLDPMMASSSRVFGGIVRIAAGINEWTPLKDACLTQCQSPLLFIQRHGGFRRDPRGALLLGLHHGSYCVGCCWMLMALLFVGGVMNVLWIALLSAFVLLQKTLPPGRVFARTAGVAFITTGAWLLAT